MQDVYSSSLKIVSRGLDETHAVTKKCSDYSLSMVFHRLAVRGLSPDSNQPFVWKSYDHPKVYLMCNGEIYNHKQLIDQYKLETISHSDCEVILHLYLKYGMMETLKLLDGVFALTLIDMRKKTIYVARDPFGVRGLSIYMDEKNLGVSSELKSLVDVVDYRQEMVQDFPGGHYMKISFEKDTLDYSGYISYFDMDEGFDPSKKIHWTLYAELERAISKRMVCDRRLGDGSPAICACLSGGLDSSIVAAVAQKIMKESGHRLKTFTIGTKDSPDLKYARMVADHIGSEHIEFIIDDIQEMLDKIPEAIMILETYDTTTIRAGTYMMELIRRIDEIYPDMVVILSGEGADESSGSYMYFKNAPNEEVFQEECWRLLKDLRFFDNRRTDRCSGKYNKEIRVPFLDLQFMKNYMAYPPNMRSNPKCEKWLLRTSLPEDLIPLEILWRTKEAMSDGVSSHDRSWYQVIQDHLKRISDDCGKSGIELEKEYYRMIFSQYYPGYDHIVPYYWEPKWTDQKDPSARLLECYRPTD